MSAALVAGWRADADRRAALAALGALGCGVDERPPALGRLPLRATAALLGAFALATLFARHPLLAARELLNFAVLLAFLLAATDQLAGDPRAVRRAVLLLVGLGAGCGALGLLETLGVLPGEFPRWGTPFNRAALGFGQPNALALFLAVVLPLAVHLVATAAHRRARLAAAFAAGATGLGLLGTFSRGSWLALAAGSALLLGAKARRLALGAWLGAGLAAVAFDVASGGALRDTVQRSFADPTLAQRAALLLAGVAMFLDAPLLGVGPGGYQEELARVAAQLPQLWDYQATPHNAYVQMAAEAGALGLAAFVFFLARVLRALLRAARGAGPGEEAGLRRALLWSFATACSAGLVVWPFAHGTGQAVLLPVALAFALDAAARPRGGRVPP